MPLLKGRMVGGSQEETDVFNRRIARMDEQLRRLQSRDWRPAKFRTAGKPLTRPGESGHQSWDDVMSPLRPRMLGEASPISNRSEQDGESPGSDRLPHGHDGATASAGSAGSSEVETSAPSEAQAAAFRLREQQLLSELVESRREVEKITELLHDREEQIRRLAVCSPPSDRRGTDRTDACCAATEQQLRAELAERERQVAALQQSERLAERRAAQQLHEARLEMAETRRQQEILSLEMQEAELQRRERCHAASAMSGSGASLLQMMRLPPEAPAELKRAHLKEAVMALKQLVQELTLNELPEASGAHSAQPRSVEQRQETCLAQADSLDTTMSTMGTMPCIPEEDSECSGSPCSPAVGT